MKRLLLFLTALAMALALSSTPGLAQRKVTLTVISAGDQNMVDYVKDYLGPQFEKDHPDVTVRAVGTGPGDAGSQKIYEKLVAEKSNATWDIDVAVIHQKAAGEMIREQLLTSYTKDVPTSKFVTSASATNALGTDATGYVIPMFNSQTAIAYNSDMVKSPPGSYDELVKWVDANPNKFGYNGIKGGMSGVSF